MIHIMIYLMIDMICITSVQSIDYTDISVSDTQPYILVDHTIIDLDHLWIH